MGGKSQSYKEGKIQQGQLGITLKSMTMKLQQTQGVADAVFEGFTVISIFINQEEIQNNKINNKNRTQ